MSVRSVTLLFVICSSFDSSVSFCVCLSPHERFSFGQNASWTLQTSLYISGAAGPSGYSFSVSFICRYISSLLSDSSCNVQRRETEDEMTAERLGRWAEAKRDRVEEEEVEGGGGRWKERREGHRCLQRMLLWTTTSLSHTLQQPRQNEVDRWDDTRAALVTAAS